MRDLKPSEVADQVGLSRSQIARLAHEIPGHRLTKGGHHRFRDCPRLWKWIEDKQKPINSVTGPLEELDEYYSLSFLKRLGRISTARFAIAVRDAKEKLDKKIKWLTRRFEPKRR